MKKQLKKFLKSYYEFERIIDITSYFMLILAFVIILPNLMEMQLGFIAAICTLVIALKITFSKLKKAFPELEKETRREYISNKKIEELNSNIKTIERRQKKIEKERRKEKKKV